MRATVIRSTSMRRWSRAMVRARSRSSLGPGRASGQKDWTAHAEIYGSGAQVKFRAAIGTIIKNY